MSRPLDLSWYNVIPIQPRTFDLIKLDQHATLEFVFVRMTDSCGEPCNPYIECLRGSSI